MNNFRRPRRGGVVLELILVGPILVLGIFGVAQFGSLMSGRQHLEQASRVAAQTAADLTRADLNGAAFPAAVQNAVTSVLNDADITPGAADFQILLEHNVPNGAAPVSPQTAGSTTPACPAPPALPAGVAGSEYIRVTVCVEAPQLAPNLLTVLGFDLSNYVYQQSTTVLYEGP